MRESAHQLPNLVLQWAPGRVLDLLFAWAEWRSLVECPKSPRLTSAADLLEVPGLGRRHFAPPSTAPREPTKLEEFNLAVFGLLPIQREILLALIALNREPWLEGEAWGECFEWFGVTPQNFVKLLADALQSLTANAQRRGLC